MNIIKNFAKLATANILAKILPFGILPFITRVIPVGEYGNFSYIATIVTIIGSVSLMGYDLSIIRL